MQRRIAGLGVARQHTADTAICRTPVAAARRAVFDGEAKLTLTAVARRTVVAPDTHVDTHAAVRRVPVL